MPVQLGMPTMRYLQTWHCDTQNSHINICAKCMQTLRSRMRHHEAMTSTRACCAPTLSRVSWKRSPLQTSTWSTQTYCSPSSAASASRRPLCDFEHASFAWSAGCLLSGRLLSATCRALRTICSSGASAWFTHLPCIGQARKLAAHASHLYACSGTLARDTVKCDSSRGSCRCARTGLDLLNHMSVSIAKRQSCKFTGAQDASWQDHSSGAATKVGRLSVY